jgi:hypothetical protein
LLVKSHQPIEITESPLIYRIWNRKAASIETPGAAYNFDL